MTIMARADSLKPVSGDCPEQQGECSNTSGDKNGDPDSAADQQLPDVWLADSERSEGSRFRLTEEY